MQRTTHSILQVISCLFLTGLALSLSAAMYKWVDEDGNVMYTETKPPGNTAFEVIQPPGKVDSARALKELRDTRNQVNKYKNERMAKEQLRKTAETEAANVEKNCNIAKNKLASLQQPRAKISQPDGSRIRLEEEERQQQLAQAQAKIDEWCN